MYALKVTAGFFLSAIALGFTHFLRAPRILLSAQLLILGILAGLAALDRASQFAITLDCTRPIEASAPGQEIQRLQPNLDATCSMHRAFRYQLHTDAFGRRVVPMAPKTGLPVLFLGCSYTAGVGVEDGEAFVSVTQSRLGGDYRVINAGLHGIGPSTILRQLERAEIYLPGVPKTVPVGVYTFFPDHIARAAGVASWRIDDFNRRVPDYLIERGALRYVGAIGDRFLPAFLASKFHQTFIKKLAYYYGIFDHFRRVRKPTYYSQEEMELTLAIVSKMRAEFHARYGGELILNIWPAHPLTEQLERIGFYAKLREGFALVTQYPKPQELKFFPNDRHPDRETHARMGEFLAGQLRQVLISSKAASKAARN